MDEPRCNHWPGQERCEWCGLGVAPSPDAPDWERLYTEEAERYARLSNVHAKCAPSPEDARTLAMAVLGGSSFVPHREAAERVLAALNRPSPTARSMVDG